MPSSVVITTDYIIELNSGSKNMGKKSIHPQEMTTLHNVTPLFKLRKPSRGSDRRTTWAQQQRPVCTKVILKSWQCSSVGKMLIMSPDNRVQSPVPTVKAENQSCSFISTHPVACLHQFYIYMRAHTHTFSLSHTDTHIHIIHCLKFYSKIYIHKTMQQHAQQI